MASQSPSAWCLLKWVKSCTPENQPNLKVCGVIRLIKSRNIDFFCIAAEVSGVFVPTLDQLLKESDFVIVTCSLNDSTRNLFGPAQFAAMKPSAIFINTSRGGYHLENRHSNSELYSLIDISLGVVDQNALVEALKSGQIAAAGLDVMTPEPLPVDHELTKMKNCGTIYCSNFIPLN